MSGVRHNPLRILHLEDNPLDRELVGQTLLGEGLACEFIYAKSKADFQIALVRGRIDLIISDFSLPGYDGMAALAEARLARPEVPFLFVSGTIGEERAVETLKRGATDYVLKNHLARLPSAVQRALKESEERSRRAKAEQELQATQARLNYLLGKSPAVIYALKILEQSVSFAWVSENIELLLGHTSQEVCHPGFWAASVHPQDQSLVASGLQQLFTDNLIAQEY